MRQREPEGRPARKQVDVQRRGRDRHAKQHQRQRVRSRRPRCARRRTSRPRCAPSSSSLPQSSGRHLSARRCETAVIGHSPAVVDHGRGTQPPVSGACRNDLRALAAAAWRHTGVTQAVPFHAVRIALDIGRANRGGAYAAIRECHARPRCALRPDDPVYCFRPGGAEGRRPAVHGACSPARPPMRSRPMASRWC